MRSIELFVRPC